MPLKLNTWHKAVIGRLRDPEYLKKLFSSLCDTKSNDIEKYTRLVYPCDYDQENEDSQKMFEEAYDENICSIFDDLSNKLFAIQNGKISLRQSFFEDFNIFTTSLDTYPFFATKVLRQSSILYDTTQRMRYIVGNLDETFRFEGLLDKQLNVLVDMHVHLGAILDFPYRIHQIILHPDKMNKKGSGDFSFELFLYLYPSISSYRFFNFFSLIESFLFNLCIGMSHAEDSIGKIAQIALQLFDSDIEDIFLLKQISSLKESFTSPRKTRVYHFENSNCEEFRLKIIEHILIFFDKKESRYNPKYGDKLIVMLFLSQMSTYPSHTKAHKLFSTYFIMRNIIKAQIFQQHRRSGFGYFSNYSRNFLKHKTNTKSIYFILKTIQHPYINTKAEIRVNIPPYAHAILNLYKEIDLTVERINNNFSSNICIKIIHHYLKTKSDDLNSFLRHENARKQNKKQTLVMLSMINNPDFRFNSNIDLTSKYFHGIDAASSEQKVPPEVFAPVYRFFKKSILSSGFALDANCAQTNLKNIDLQYTFHVGEEFRDIISGLRSIVEAIYFLDLKDEDRLGHAVALGIDPHMFIQERQEISLSQGEFFDNLVFVYSLLQKVETPPIQLHILKSHFDMLAFQIYGDLIEKYHLSVDDFIDAWLLRRNCPIPLQELLNYFKIYNTNENPFWTLRKKVKEYSIEHIFPKGFESEYAFYAIPDFVEQEYENSNPIERYKSAQNNPKAYLIFYNYITNKSIRKRYLTLCSHKTPYDEDVYIYLQDYVMQHVIASKDIIIEIMPTSNVLITPINSFEKHPFLRFHPPGEIIPNDFHIRENKIKIIIGSDDPGIQGTNLLMELNHIKTVVEKLYGKDVAVQYIKNLLEFSNYVFNK